jgi:hypothetical protein
MTTFSTPVVFISIGRLFLTLGLLGLLEIETSTESTRMQS